MHYGTCEMSLSLSWVSYYRDYTLLWYIHRNMHTVHALLCCVVFKYRSNIHIPRVTSLALDDCYRAVQQPLRIWVNISYESAINDSIISANQKESYYVAGSPNRPSLSMLNRGGSPRGPHRIWDNNGFRAVSSGIFKGPTVKPLV